MAAKTKSAEEQAAIATAKELRERDAALAMREYQAERLNLAARTEKLRAMRLARDLDAVRHPQPQPSAAQRKPATARGGKRQQPMALMSASDQKR